VHQRVHYAPNVGVTGRAVSGRDRDGPRLLPTLAVASNWNMPDENGCSAKVSPSQKRPIARRFPRRREVATTRKSLRSHQDMRDDASGGLSARRQESRLRLRLPAFAIMHSGTERVVLCDLSQRGAKIFSNADLPIGRDFVLRWGKLEAFGEIVWKRDGLNGVQFDEALAPSVLIATRDLLDAGGLNRIEVGQWVAKTGWAFGKALS
jgi:hypothetical protein